VALAEAAASEVVVDSAAVMEALATTKRSPAPSIWRPVRVVIDRILFRCGVTREVVER
jgi:hypothetical protein